MISIDLMSENIRVFCSHKTWLEGDALNQFRNVCALPGFVRGAAYPDLHPGHGIPVGTACLFRETIYPFLIGGDIGCGMNLSMSDLPVHKWKPDRALRRLTDDPEYVIRHRARELCVQEEHPDDPAHQLGTLGRGNHFAEILAVDSIMDPDRFSAWKLNSKHLFLLIHSGSRSYGERFASRFAAAHGAEGLSPDSESGQVYLAGHDRLIHWARYNRRLSAQAFHSLLGSKGTEVLDSVHNRIERMPSGLWLHRKGAAEARTGEPVLIAGTRGSSSYLVAPKEVSEETLFSLAHGAGRKWTRLSTRSRIRAKYREEELRRTPIGSRVLCPDRDLLCEEAPDAYKNIEQVIQDLTDFHLIDVVASFRPLLNCKP